MIAFILSRNGTRICCASEPRLYGLSLECSVDRLGYGSADKSATGDRREATFSVTGSAFDSTTSKELIFEWINNRQFTIGEVLELQVSDIDASFTEVATAPQLSEERVNNFIPLSTGIALRVEHNGQAKLFGGENVGSIWCNIFAVGFLGPASVGNEYDRQHSITSGVRIFYNIEGCVNYGSDRELIRWAFNAPIQVGDRLTLQLDILDLQKLVEEYEVIR